MDKSIGKMLVIMLLSHANILLHYCRGSCSGLVLDSTVKNHYCVRMQKVQPSLQILYLKLSPSLSISENYNLTSHFMVIVVDILDNHYKNGDIRKKGIIYTDAFIEILIFY